MSPASSRVLICISLAVAVGCLAPCAASAHRFGGPNDPCERKIGTSLIHITLYQPEFDPDGEYCNEVPRAGNTVLVVDVLGDELRKMPLGVQVLATQGPQSQRTVLSIPPKIYRRGVADAQAMLDGGGTYLTRISVGEGAALQVLSFPIRVAPWYRPLMVPALIIFGIVAFIALSTIRYYWTPAPDDSSLGLPAGKSPRSLPSLRGGQRRASGSTLDSSIALLALITCSLSFVACDRKTLRHEPSLPDVQVIDDHGNPLALRSLRGKIVLLDFIHVGCPGVCSNLVNKFGQVADRLGSELGSRVILLSVTNDPVHDSPTELLKLARSSQADMKGWLFVTGKLDDVNRVIKEFGLNNERLPDGSPNHITAVFLLGSDGRQKSQYRGMVMNSDAVVTQVKNMLEREGAS